VLHPCGRLRARKISVTSKRKISEKKGKLPAAIEGHRHHIIVGYNYIQAAHKQW
jgi:hypothetical protein